MDGRISCPDCGGSGVFNIGKPPIPCTTCSGCGEVDEREYAINTVNPGNFNETCKGYVVRAMRDAGCNALQRSKLLSGLRWAFDEMTMEDARRECEKYERGEIKFRSSNTK